jgi:hypothetical protein
MDTTLNLISTLDPKGVEVLKRKLLEGKISPDLFKGVLKRQMVKKREQTDAKWIINTVKSIFDNMSSALQNPRGAIRLATQTETQPSLSRDELISLVLPRRI